jgi:hypothetical protein
MAVERFIEMVEATFGLYKSLGSGTRTPPG